MFGGGSDMLLLRSLLLLLFVSLGEVCCTYVSVNGGTKTNQDFQLPYKPHTTATLTCYPNNVHVEEEVNPYWVVNGDAVQSNITIDFHLRMKVATYTYVADQIASTTTLECTCDCGHCIPCHKTVTVTLEGPPSTSSAISGPPSTSSATSAPTKPPVSGTATNKPKKFKGVNPLIYTVIAVFLLGTLAVVAIVTCWIRARKTLHRRHRLPQFTTPRDYFDGISDSDFTPLTANQFYASLRDAPPTYHESEVIQASLRDDQANRDSSHDQSPPPLPPRDYNNISRRNGSPSNVEEPAQQSGQQHSLSPTRLVEDEVMLVPSTAIPAGTTSLPNDTLLL